MKIRLIVLMLAFACHTLALAQNASFQGNNMLKPSNLRLEYYVNLKETPSTVSAARPWFSNEATHDILRICLDAALKGKIPFYSPHSASDVYEIANHKERITNQEIRERLGERHDTIEIIEESGKSKTQVKVTPFDPNELTGIAFIEDWVITETPLAMTKEVIGMIPVRQFYRNDDPDQEYPLYKKAFLWLDVPAKKSALKKSDARMVLTNKIQYEFFFHTYYPFNNLELTQEIERTTLEQAYDARLVVSPMQAPYLNTFGVERFARIMINKVLSGQIQAYDMTTDKPISADRVKRNLGGRMDTVMIEDIFTGLFRDTVVEHTINPAEITSLIFHEDWYTDPKTLRMKKKVRALSFVREFVDEDKLTLKKNIAFTLHLEE